MTAVSHAEKIAQLAGGRTGMYPDGYLDEIREGWAENEPPSISDSSSQ